MSVPAIPLPEDVIEYVVDVFSGANDRVAGRLDRMPTLHEETLDFELIAALSEASGPHLAASGALVDFEVHFIGGGRHVDRWEIADIGLIINFRISGSLVRTKILLLQSKRLYPRESEFVEDVGLVRPGGFGSLMHAPQFAASRQRSFRFDAACRYRALQVGDEQWQAIARYETHYGIPVHYLLYHPSELPWQVSLPALLPVQARQASAEVGCRVLSAERLRALTSPLPRNYAPSAAEVSVGSHPGEPIHEFIRDEVLTCRQGYIAEEPATDAGLLAVFTQRSAPISAAIRFDIDVPGDLIEDLAAVANPWLG